MMLKISGKIGSGRTTEARKISELGKTFMTNEIAIKKKYWAEDMDLKTKFIIVDDVVNYEETHQIFDKTHLTIFRRGNSPVSIKMPHIILVCQE